MCFVAVRIALKCCGNVENLLSVNALNTGIYSLLTYSLVWLKYAKRVLHGVARRKGKF